MSDFYDHLEVAVEIVNKWGETRLPNNKILSDHFTFDTISLWEIMAPNLAIFFISPYLKEADENGLTFLTKIRPHISYTKERLFTNLKAVKSRRTAPKIESKIDILLLGYSFYMYRDVLAPVARLLSSEGFSCKVVHDREAGFNAFDSSHIPVESLYQYASADVRVQVRDFSERVRNAVKEFKAMDVIHSFSNYNGHNLSTCVEKAFNWLFNYYYRLAPWVIVLTREFIRLNKPKIILSSDVADPRTRIATIIAQQQGVKVVEVQLGPLGKDGVEWRYFRADRIATWGEINRRALLEHHVPDEKIVITGSPRHDDLVNIDKTEVERLKAEYQIPADAKLILCASTYFLKQYSSNTSIELINSLKKSVFDAVIDLKNIYLLIKLHPLESREQTEALISNSKNIILIEGKRDIRTFIKASDVFIGFGTTATVDAMIANKFIICPVFDGWIWSDFFLNTNAVYVPRSKGEVRDIVELIAVDKYHSLKNSLDDARQKYLQDLVYRADGKSTRRVAELAIDMLRDNENSAAVI